MGAFFLICLSNRVSQLCNAEFIISVIIDEIVLTSRIVSNIIPAILGQEFIKKIESFALNSFFNLCEYIAHFNI